MLTQFLGHIVRGEPIKLVDGGSQTRAFTFIDDAVDCLTRIIDNPGGIADGKIYNIGNPHNLYSIRQLAEMMLEIALSRPEYAPTARNTRLIDISALDYYGKGYADIPARLPSIKNTTAELGWTPKTDMRTALMTHLRLLRAQLCPRPPRCCRTMLEGARIGLKVDVDTLRGTREGVPRLACAVQAARRGCDFLFFRRAGSHRPRHAPRVPQGLRAEGGTHLGAQALRLKTLLYGVLLPGPGHRPQGGCRDARVCTTRDSRWACTTYDHVRWQDNVAQARCAPGRAGNSSAASRHSSGCSDSCPSRTRPPAGRSTPMALALELEYGLRYASDTRGGPPFLP